MPQQWFLHGAQIQRVGILSFGDKTDGKMRHTAIFFCPSPSQHLDASNFFSN